MIVPITTPKVAGNSYVLSVSRVTTPNVPPPPPFSAQNRSGLVQSLAIRTWPSAVTTSASSRSEAPVPKPFEKTPEAAALHEPADPHRDASTALNIAARPWSSPHCTGSIHTQPAPKLTAGCRRALALQPFGQTLRAVTLVIGPVQISSESGALEPPR